MAKAALLILGAAAYLYFLQLGHDMAESGLTNVQYLYTHAAAVAAAEDR
jgi:hypothetical protein